MNNKYKNDVLTQLSSKYGEIKKVGASQSLFSIPSIECIIYFRYSKILNRDAKISGAFYGLRKVDLDFMRGKKSFICFLTDDKNKNIVIPFSGFEGYFLKTKPADDGQFKAQSFFKPQGAELYFARIGKFKVDNYLGINALLGIEKTALSIPKLSHSQVQSLVGSIGVKKGFDVWFPKNDISKIDETIINIKKIKKVLPHYSHDIANTLSVIDVIWFQNTEPVAFYEIEHSTPIYSGLLRFNDVLLSIPKVDNFNIVASYDRENKFSKEINRPTFKQNKLIECVSFLDYSNVYCWYYHLTGEKYG